MGIVYLYLACVSGLEAAEQLYRGNGSTDAALISALKDPSAKHRREAAIALGRMGPAAEAAVPALIAAAQTDRDLDVRREARDALTHIGPGALIAAWNNSDEQVRDYASLVIALMEPADTVPGLSDALQDPDLNVRRQAAITLWRITANERNRKAAGAAAPALAAALKDPDTGVREYAVRTLEAIGPAARVAAAALAAALKDPEARVRGYAAGALRRMGSAARVAVPALIEALEDPDSGVRHNAAEALRLLGPSADAAVPTLIGALEDPKHRVRQQAASALGHMGPAAEAAIPALATALNDPDIRVRREAAISLRRLAPVAEAAIPALIAVLEDAGPTAMPGIGSASSQATDTSDLFGLVTRRYAAEALVRMAPASIPYLISVLKHPDTESRYYASGALVRIGPATVPALIAELKDADPVNRAYAVRTLLRLGPAAGAAAPALGAALEDPDANVRKYAAIALERIGPPAEAPQIPTATSRSAPSASSAGELGEDMVRIEPGCFRMGSPSNEAGRVDSERRHWVCIYKAFGIGKYEVTSEEYAHFTRATGRRLPKNYLLRRGSHPVINVSWDDAHAYAAWLSGKTGKHYRLPTEAEWEYAARAGTTTARFWGDDPDEACSYGNVYDQGSERSTTANREVHRCDDGHAKTAPAGRFQPNPWGLYDVLGNVWEWTCSAYRWHYDGEESYCTWVGAAGRRANRGGAWNTGPRNVRAAHRGERMPATGGSSQGFRLAQDL